MKSVPTLSPGGSGDSIYRKPFNTYTDVEKSSNSKTTVSFNMVSLSNELENREKYNDMLVEIGPLVDNGAA